MTPFIDNFYLKQNEFSFSRILSIVLFLTRWILGGPHKQNQSSICREATRNPEQ